jgi:hypothetical protein
LNQRQGVDAFYGLSDNIFVACLVTTRCTSRELCP